MSARTAPAITSDLVAAIAHQWFNALHDAGTSAKEIAAAIGRDASLVEDWAKGDQGRGTKHVPFYALAHDKVPAAVRLRMLGWALERLHAARSRVPLTASTVALLKLAGDLVTAAANALLDGTVDDSERAALRPIVARLHAACARWLADHGGGAEVRS